MMKHGGIPTADSYGGYMGADGFCHMNDPNVVIGFQIEVILASVAIKQNITDAVEIILTVKSGEILIACGTEVAWVCES